MKLISSPAWVEAGQALRRFWKRAVVIVVVPVRAPIAFDWQHTSIQALLEAGQHVWFSILTTVGELSLGTALILRVSTGI